MKVSHTSLIAKLYRSYHLDTCMYDTNYIPLLEIDIWTDQNNCCYIVLYSYKKLKYSGIVNKNYIICFTFSVCIWTQKFEVHVMPNWNFKTCSFKKF